MSDPAHTVSIDPAEVAKFSAMADEWWDPTGKFAPLHKFNPVRLRFIRETAAHHFGRDAKALHPFEGLSLLDIGCGGGLLAEPMARLGFAVTGADAAEKNVKTAAAHAAETGLDIAYRAETAEALATEGLALRRGAQHGSGRARGRPEGLSGGLCEAGGAGRDHDRGDAEQDAEVAGAGQDRGGVRAALGAAPAPMTGTASSPPAQLHALLEDAGLKVLKTQGVAFDPLAWDWRLAHDTDVNYMVVAGR